MRQILLSGSPGPPPQAKSSPRKPIFPIHCRLNLDHSFLPFTPNEVKKALENGGSSTALSPDVLFVIQLPFAHACILDIWKHAITVPLPEPVKPKDKGPLTSLSLSPFLLPN